jgi:NADH:ubiquinone oxidoreductase subunit K
METILIMDINSAIWITGSLGLFIIGLYGISTKRDLFKVLISIELLLTSANLILLGSGFISFSSSNQADPLVQSFAILSQSVGGGLIGVALIYLLAIYKHNKTLNSKSIRKLKW